MLALSRFVAVAGFAAAIAIPSGLSAQGCQFGDDGFAPSATSACCNPALPNIPKFPYISTTGEYASFLNCNVEALYPVNVTLLQVQVLCDIDFFVLQVTPTGPNSPAFNGTLLGKYSRTWMEPRPVPFPPRQVWRYLVNGDLTPTAGAAPTPLPPHAAGALYHLHGHIDYACEEDPITGAQVWSAMMSLHHLPGCIDHNFFSSALVPPPQDHNDRSYHLVAPAGFNWQAPAFTSSTVSGEAVRSTRLNPYTCLTEATMLPGNINVHNPDCLCPPFVTPPLPVMRWVHYDINTSATCGLITSPIVSLPMSLPLPPLFAGCITLPIGTWLGAPGEFPGNRNLFTHWGVLQYPDPCNPFDPSFHVVQGISTHHAEFEPFGYEPGPGIPPITGLLDLQDMISTAPYFGGPFAPNWGSVYLSKMIFNFNLP